MNRGADVPAGGNYSGLTTELLTPRSVGETIDGAVALYKRYFWHFLSILFIYALFSSVLSVATNIVIYMFQGRMQGLLEMLGSQASENAMSLKMMETLFIVSALAGFLNVIAVVMFAIMLGAVSVSVREIIAGADPNPWNSINDSFKATRRIVFATVAAVVCVYGAGAAVAIPLAVFVGMFLLVKSIILQAAIIAGISLFGGMAVAVALAKVIFSPIVALLEGRQKADAALRSAKLVYAPRKTKLFAHPIWKVTVALTLLSAIWLSYSSFVLIPRAVLFYIYELQQIISGKHMFQMQSAPLAYELILTAGSIIYTSLVMPFIVIGLALFYYNLRSRKEGLDVLSRLKAGGLK